MATDSNIDRIVSFWFDPRYPYRRWFIKSPALDAEIKSEFGPLVLAARTTKTLDHWAQSPGGCLALLLLLDQFPRNIFRDSADAYLSDQKALTTATQAIAQGFDRAVPLLQQAFFYLPFEHEEQLLSQITSVSLFEGLAARCEAGAQEKQFADKCVEYAIRHRDVIAKFGQFPHRNLVLQRRSTAEELEFLKTNPLGF
ncbi:hypothetical protein IMSHALPRED_000917 [Imshaugia aleurites]|uniref:DUF924 domain-containing protein n=1 Tax=Imshaugia aleurites TaxID=172621 RepID=A0A8H3IGT5_9LECA|nr:hypothetical protein IMSHALPRED_000917 [Imshaugia aleurites]